MSDLHTVAAREYAERPKDERYDSLQSMITAAEHDRKFSQEVTYNCKDLRVIVTDSDPTLQAAVGRQLQTDASPIVKTLQLQSPRASAKFTHWSFGQLCRFVGAPAGYLRQLPPAIAADALNHGLQNETDHASDARILVKRNGSDPIVRAVTSDTYGRVWDAELSGALQSTIAQQAGWKTPPTWSGEPAGVYRGDRDSFVILINGGSIVNDPSGWDRASGKGDAGAMYRGILVRNSEVGHCSIWIDLILFRAICGNHLLWGATYDQRFKRRHVGQDAKRDAIRTILSAARNFTQAGAAADEAIIRQLIDREIAHTEAGVIDELKAIGATKDQALAAVQACSEHETASPRSFWGVSQGLTRVSQTSGYQDDRLELDQLAAAVLARGRKLVAV